MPNEPLDDLENMTAEQLLSYNPLPTLKDDEREAFKNKMTHIAEHLEQVNENFDSDPNEAFWEFIAAVGELDQLNQLIGQMYIAQATAAKMGEPPYGN